MARLVTGAGLVAALVAPAARADIMHWYWEVEVNGEAVDASRPIGVGPGDEVLIDLWASWSPQGDGFAWSWFSVSTGDTFFDVASSVDISEAHGLGRNPSLAALADENGTFVDTDGSGSNDLIDWIDAGQLSRHFGHFDDAHPMNVYSIRWLIGETIESRITLRRADVVTTGQERFQLVYVDEWGNEASYSQVEDDLVFVPSPSGLMTVLLMSAAARRGVSAARGAGAVAR